MPRRRSDIFVAISFQIILTKWEVFMDTKLKIGIVGGSIAGCSAAILLARAGYHITVFERSMGALVGRGGGIGTTSPALG